MDERRQALIGDAGRALQRYQRSVQAFDDAVGRSMALGPTDVRCLDWLADGAKTAGQLSTATGLRPAATTALIDRLVERGLVERVRGEGDRRQVLVRMTAEAQRLTWEAYGPLVEEGQRQLADVTVAELESMVRQLDSMRELNDRHRARIESSGES
jgi:DNA-binding MarR family transcriptional regulator